MRLGKKDHPYISCQEIVWKQLFCLEVQVEGNLEPVGGMHIFFPPKIGKLVSHLWIVSHGSVVDFLGARKLFSLRRLKIIFTQMKHLFQSFSVNLSIWYFFLFVLITFSEVKKTSPVFFPLLKLVFHFLGRVFLCYLSYFLNPINSHIICNRWDSMG